MRRKCLLCPKGTYYSLCWRCIYSKEKSRKGRRAESCRLKRHRHTLRDYAYDGLWENVVRAYEEDR